MNKQWDEKMATTKPKFYWHIHHEILLEKTSNIQKRIDYIKANKPEKEIPLRLKLMTPVLHPEKLPDRFQKALEDYDKAWEDYYKVQQDYFKALEDYNKAQHYNKALEDYDKILEDSNKAFEDYNKKFKAYDKVREASAADIEKLHREEHPDCPWNGKTIFSKVD